MELKDLESIVGIVESLITCFAVIIGGIWAYIKFIKKREKFPRASTTHRITEKKLNEEKKLVSLFILIENIGEVLLSIVFYDVRLNQVLPLDNELSDKISKNENPVSEDEYQIPWKNLFHLKKELPKDSYELEPSEKQELMFDFVVDANVKAIQIYSYFKNKSKHDREIGWDRITYHDLN